jgi:hypothetical protein
VSFGYGDTQSDQERSRWQYRYKAFKECYSKKTEDTRSGDPRKMRTSKGEGGKKARTSVGFFAGSGFLILMAVQFR